MNFTKFVLLLISLVVINSVHAQNRRAFKELNVGAAYSPDNMMDAHVFPGVSFLWGETYQNNKRILEWEAGIALPSIATGKLTLAYGELNKYSGISLRVWPLMIGPQFKMGQLTLSAELGTDTDISFYAQGIFTIGFRFDK